jgi:carboxymethylenebutenolidase
MLIKESFADVETLVDGKEGSMRIFLFHPTIPGYPNARFPGVVLFSEIYQGEMAFSPASDQQLIVCGGFVS